MRIVFPGITHTRPGGAEMLVIEVAQHARAAFGIETVLMGDSDAFAALSRCSGALLRMWTEV